MNRRGRLMLLVYGGCLLFWFIIGLLFIGGILK